MNASLYSDLSTVPRKNNALERAGLEYLGFRLPSLRVETSFYYKLVEDQPYSIGIHAHSHWEISRPMTGAANYVVGVEGEETRVAPSPTRYLVIPPALPHRWDLEKPPLLLNSWQVGLHPEDEAGEMLLAQLRAQTIQNEFIFDALDVQAGSEDLLWNLTAEKLRPSIMGAVVSGVARLVVGSLIGSVKPWPRALRERENEGAPTKSLANKLKDFLEANLQRSVTLVDLELHFHYSSRHLNRIFHQHFGLSIGQYLRDRRFELATLWLATTNRSIKDIALSLGYGNISHFCRSFRKRQNVSPTEYRDIKSNPR